MLIYEEYEKSGGFTKCTCIQKEEEVVVFMQITFYKWNGLFANCMKNANESANIS